MKVARRVREQDGAALIIDYGHTRSDAGDTFQAALLTWLAENDRLDASAIATLQPTSIEAALRFASRAAAITCSRRGADLPRRAELG